MYSKSTKKSKRISSFAIINPDAAGIDIGDTEISIAIGPEKCDQNVRTFHTFTRDLVEAVKFLQEHSIKTVAMECTGVYWVQLYMLLEKNGINAVVANARFVKNVSGRKDDENDAMWIQRLHSCGLVSNCFQPDWLTREMRELMRYRKKLVQGQAQCTNRIIKCLELMNIKVHTVLSDIDGMSGRAIVEAIIHGERDPKNLALLASKRVKASSEELEKSLEGNWNHVQLFILAQQYEIYKNLSQAIGQVDLQVEKQLEAMILSKNGHIDLDETIKRKRSTRKNQIPFNATAYLKGLTGVDITAIPGISELTALTIIAESGTDVTRWPTANHYKSWLNVVPTTEVTGGKIRSERMKKRFSHAGQSYRMAANAVRTSKSSLGQFFFRKQTRGGPAKAVLAVADKLATIVYHMIGRQQEYNPHLLAVNGERSRAKEIARLEKRLETLKLLTLQTLDNQN
jgi:transposase